MLTGDVYFAAPKELAGYADHEVANTPEAFDLLHPDDLEPVLARRAHIHDDRPLTWNFASAPGPANIAGFPAAVGAQRRRLGQAPARSVTDVNDRHRSAALRREGAALVTLKSIGDAVITVDLEAGGSRSSGKYLTGWKTHEAEGMPLAIVCRMLEETTRTPLADPAERVVVEGRMVKATANVLLLRRDGTEIAINESAAPIRDRTGDIAGVVLVLHDARREREYASQLSYQASHDALTGLINRREFEQRLGLALLSARDLGRTHVMHPTFSTSSRSSTIAAATPPATS